MLYIISGIIILIIIIIIMGMVSHHKFQYILIRIDEANTSIQELLKNKIDLLEKIIPLIQEKAKDEEFLDDFQNPQDQLLAEQNETLKNYYVEVIKELEEHDSLLNDEEINTLLNSLENNEEELVASIKFYNDNTLDYNHLIDSFPSNLFRLVFRYKRKELYSNEKKEIYEILKNS